MMKTLHFLTVISLGAWICSCSPTTLPSTPNSDLKNGLNPIKPRWVTVKPTDEDYYAGIGHVTKNTSDNYMQAAKKAALQDLASEIKVTISSSSFLFQMEDGHKFQESYQSKIMTTVTDEIADFEMAGSWEDEQGYWVYYRLSKQAYAEAKAKKRNDAQHIALDFFRRAKALENDDPQTALGYYLQAFYNLRDYLDDANRIDYNGKEILLGNEIHAAAQEILSQVQLRTGTYPQEINRRLGQGLSVPILASLRSGEPLSNIPLEAHFEIGEGTVHPSYNTDVQGRAKVIVSKISSKETQQRVRVRIDLRTLSQSKDDELYDMLLDKLISPEASIPLYVKKPSAYLTSREAVLGNMVKTHQIRNRLKTLLSTEGFTFSPDKNDADLWIDLDADTEAGPVSGSIHITYLTLSIKVISMETNKEIYSTGLNRVKGFGLDYHKSSQEGYEKAIELLEKDTVEELMEGIL